MKKIKVFADIAHAFEYIEADIDYGNNSTLREGVRNAINNRDISFYEEPNMEEYKNKYFSSNTGKLQEFQSGTAPIPKTETTGEKLKMKKGLYGNPIVPRVVMGHPINSRRLVKQKMPSYAVAINLSYPFFWTPEEVMRANIEAVQEFLALEGTKRLYLVSGCNGSDEMYDNGQYPERVAGKTRMYSAVMIDITNDIQNMARLMFVLGSPDTLRRVCLGAEFKFRAVELTPNGIGYRSTPITRKAELEKELKFQFPNKEILIIDKGMGA